MNKITAVLVAGAMLSSVCTAFAQDIEKPWVASIGMYQSTLDETYIGSTVKADAGISLTGSYTFKQDPSIDYFLSVEADFFTVKEEMTTFPMTKVSTQAYRVAPMVGLRYALNTDGTVYAAPAIGISYSHMDLAGDTRNNTKFVGSIALGYRADLWRAEVNWNVLHDNALDDGWGIKIGYRF